MMSGRHGALFQFRYGVEEDPAAFPAGTARKKEIPRLFAAEAVKLGAGQDFVETKEDSTSRRRQFDESL